jgi:ubiquinone biosynthesis protein UbiJ
MLEAMKTLAERSVLERIVLLVNHVLSSEPQAMERLRAHASRTIRIEFGDWPTLLPALAPLAFRVTPPGLVEWIEGPAPDAADLRVTVDASNPALALFKFVVGERPAVSVDGDAAFASDVDWLIHNLRWDIQDDLARFVGDAPAREIARFGGAIAKALREGARKLDEFARRPDRPREPPAAEPPAR